MQKLNVSMGKSLDSRGRTRFHSRNIEEHILGTFPEGYGNYDRFGGYHKVMGAKLNEVLYFYYEIKT